MVVAGGGELLDGFRAQAAAAGVGGRVHFLDKVPHAELPNVLRASDLFVLTTEPPESFGIVLIEAMACGLPAIATDYPGVRAVVDERTGVLIGAGDSAAAAEALDRFVDMGAEGRASMGAEGREKALREWAWPALLDRMDAAYAEAIAARREKLGRGGVTAKQSRSSRSPHSLLLVSYFYPPTRDTGAQRPAAMAKWLARSGWDVTVLTTTAFGAASPADASVDGVRVIRARDLQTVRARLAGHSKVDSLFDSDSYSGKPHPLSKVIVPEPLAVAWAPFARRAALAAHRERPFDCVLTTSPPESAHTIGHALHRKGVPWVADVRDAWTFEPLRPRVSDRRPAQARRAARTAATRGRRSGRLRQ